MIVQPIVSSIVSPIARAIGAGGGSGPAGNPLPAFAADTEEYEFDIGDPPWTGTIPDPAIAVDLVTFLLEETEVTGTIPSFASNTALAFFTLNDCDGLTGDTPIFSTVATGCAISIGFCDGLTGNIVSIPDGCEQCYVGDNPLTGYTAGAFPTSLVDLYAANAALSLAAVNAIVDAAFTAGWGAGGEALDISGGTSATPSAAQIIKIDAMILAGANIAYNA